MEVRSEAEEPGESGGSGADEGRMSRARAGLGGWAAERKLVRAQGNLGRGENQSSARGLGKRRGPGDRLGETELRLGVGWEMWETRGGGEGTEDQTGGRGSGK